MSIIYLFVCCGVAAILLGLLADAVASVSRPTEWGPAPRALRVVTTVERRTNDLPFVGTDRRRARTGAQVATELREVKAA